MRNTETSGSCLKQWSAPPKEAYCGTRQDIELAAREMIDACIAEYQNRSSEDLKWHQFHDTYRAIIEHSDLIANSYIRVWQACDSSFLFATQKRKRTGLSAIWPLSDWAYEKMRAGKLSFADIEQIHVQPGSQNLFINSTRELTPSKQFSWSDITNSVSHTALYQMALLSQNSWDNSFRILCIAGSPNNVEHIESNGFVALKNRMAEIPFPMFEFSTTIDQNFEHTTSLKAQENSLKGFPISCGPDQIKRISLRGTVAAYQQVLGKNL